MNRLTRGHDTDGEKLARLKRDASVMQELWGDALARDPFHNYNFAPNRLGPVFASPTLRPQAVDALWCRRRRGIGMTGASDRTARSAAVAGARLPCACTTRAPARPVLSDWNARAGGDRARGVPAPKETPSSSWAVRPPALGRPPAVAPVARSWLAGNRACRESPGAHPPTSPSSPPAEKGGENSIPTDGDYWIPNNSRGALAILGPAGITWARSVAFGASTPWKRIRCNRGRGTSAAGRCMNSSGDITMWVVPSCQADFRRSTTLPVRFNCSRSLAIAGRVMYRHSCSSRWRASRRRSVLRHAD